VTQLRAAGYPGWRQHGSTFVGANSYLQSRDFAPVRAENDAGDNSNRTPDAVVGTAGRYGGVGVSHVAIDDAFVKPINIRYQPTQYGPTFQYIGRNATVVVNLSGKVTTAWANNSTGRGKN
jgi:hypothetical protein